MESHDLRKYEKEALRLYFLTDFILKKAIIQHINDSLLRGKKLKEVLEDLQEFVSAISSLG